MSDIIVVRIYNTEKYKPFAKKYGVLEDSLIETAVINWDGTGCGICTNVSHRDYGIIHPNNVVIINGEILVCYGYGDFERTGLKVY